MGSSSGIIISQEAGWSSPYSGNELQQLLGSTGDTVGVKVASREGGAAEVASRNAARPHSAMPLSSHHSTFQSAQGRQHSRGRPVSAYPVSSGISRLSVGNASAGRLPLDAWDSFGADEWKEIPDSSATSPRRATRPSSAVTDSSSSFVVSFSRPTSAVLRTQPSDIGRPKSATTPALPMQSVAAAAAPANTHPHVLDTMPSIGEYIPESSSAQVYPQAGRQLSAPMPPQYSSSSVHGYAGPSNSMHSSDPIPSKGIIQEPSDHPSHVTAAPPGPALASAPPAEAAAPLRPTSASLPKSARDVMYVRPSSAKSTRRPMSAQGSFASSSAYTPQT